MRHVQNDEQTTASSHRADHKKSGDVLHRCHQMQCGTFGELGGCIGLWFLSFVMPWSRLELEGVNDV